MYYVYMIKNSSRKLYVGITTNPNQRLRTHNQRQGARFTKYIPTYDIVFLETYQSLSEARKREIQIKNWRREKKEVLIKRYQQKRLTRM